MLSNGKGKIAEEIFWWQKNYIRKQLGGIFAPPPALVPRGNRLSFALL
jgi:hypothetical protein